MMDVFLPIALYCALAPFQTQSAGNPEPVASPGTAVVMSGAPRIFIDPKSGLDSYVPAAMIKKRVPAVVTLEQAEARFLLTGTIDQKKESTGSKVARCLFLYCAGIEGVQTVTVTLTDSGTHEVIWAYTVKKPSAHAYQSTAEAVAKHLKQFLEQRPM